MQWFVSSDVRFGFGHVVKLPGKRFECRNAPEFWNDASGGRRPEFCGGSINFGSPEAMDSTNLSFLCHASEEGEGEPSGSMGMYER